MGYPGTDGVHHAGGGLTQLGLLGGHPMPGMPVIGGMLMMGLGVPKGGPLPVSLPPAPGGGVVPPPTPGCWL